MRADLSALGIYARRRVNIYKYTDSSRIQIPDHDLSAFYLMRAVFILEERIYITIAANTQPRVCALCLA